MKKFLEWLTHLFIGEKEVRESLAPEKRYRRFRRTLFLVMFGVLLIPLCVVTSMSFYRYRDLLQIEEIDNLRWNAESSKKTIEKFMEELVSVLSFTASQYSYDELTDQKELNQLLRNLKSQYPGVVDLGIIDNDGIQKAYSGPYDLLGKDYSSRDCFLKVSIRKTYIGNVELGYRKVPHFCIAVSSPIHDTHKNWTFRTSIDAETLKKYVDKTTTQSSDDIFLVSRKQGNELQTESRYYGNVLDPYSLNFLPSATGITIDTEKGFDGKPLLKAKAYIDETPWVLVLIKQGYIYGKRWTAFKEQLLLIFATSTVLAILVIIKTTNLLVNRIREADGKRESLLSEMEHTNKLASVGRLAAGVAHEINNPLAIISEKAGLIKDYLELSDDFDYKEKITAQIEGTDNAVERCKVITHRLLGFARRMDVSLESIGINTLMREVTGFLEKEMLYRGIQLNLDLGNSLPPIESDRGQLQQIFLNLLNNAIEAIQKEGVISISTTVQNRSLLQVKITDNGPGIPPGVIKNIFEPFFTTKTSGEKKGTGLGLSITYGLIKKLGGDISVRSSVGSGTTFTVQLPVKSKMSRRSADV